MGIQYQPFTVIPTLFVSDVRFWVTCVVKIMSLHHVEADSHLKLLPSFISDKYKVLEHIDMLSLGIW